MKLFLTGLLFICCTSFVQTGKYPVAKLYAYQQKVSGGANFSSKEKGKANLQQYVYLLVRTGRNVTIDDVWIDGRKASFTTEEVTAPVTIEKSIKLSNNPEAETLVPSTTHTVLQVLLTSVAETKEGSSPARYKSYPLLLQYTENAKIFFLGAKSWALLSPKVNQ